MVPGSWLRWSAVALVALLATVPFLGSARKLTYHEAIVAQGAREMSARGDWLVPTLNGIPWLEKPPLAHWGAIASEAIAGRHGEWTARLPAAIAAALLCVGVATIASRRFSPLIGLIAGFIQATTVWTVDRGRLGEADILLAAIVVWAIAAFDRLRIAAREGSEAEARRHRWIFFGLLGATATAKGIGFGAAILAATTIPALIWDRDGPTARRLLGSRRPWLLAGAIALAWPLFILWRHPAAISIWWDHIAGRLTDEPEHFAGRSALGCLWELAGQALPWLLLAPWGARISIRHALADRDPGHRLLWCWALGPSLPLLCATIKNPHYFLAALPPLSIWSALGLLELAKRLEALKGWPLERQLRLVPPGFALLAASYSLIFGLACPRFDSRGREWAFYEALGRSIAPDERVEFIYSDWDRTPYATPFGSIPHDLAVRLFYLNHPATWRRAGEGPPVAVPTLAIGRSGDREALEALGRVKPLASGPDHRPDRAYILYRIRPHDDLARRQQAVAMGTRTPPAAE